MASAFEWTCQTATDSKTDGQTADALMASATAAAGREFYWEYWDRFGGEYTTNDVCNWRDYLHVHKEANRVGEISRIVEVVFLTCSNRSFHSFLPLAFAKKVELQISHLAVA